MNWDELNQQIILCRACPRLVEWREEVSRTKRKAYLDWDYWGKPVPGFGDQDARILILGLAPGAHGSNRTGRMFTGDSSGDFLYPALFKAGFANQPRSKYIDDGLQLNDVFITAVCRCVPPKNRPLKHEIINCRTFLLGELDLLKKLQGIVALGHIAFESCLEMLQNEYALNFEKRPTFEHGKIIKVRRSPFWLLSSYHPSRQNTQTGRLTEKMFSEIWNKAAELQRNAGEDCFAGNLQSTHPDF